MTGAECLEVFRNFVWYPVTNWVNDEAFLWVFSVSTIVKGGITVIG